ncbi:hypothetical protein DFH94DRAFT_109195 [Russula ochroleuca]|uniref:Protein CPL1-like domain-containing protein n=1 Tax=Russula ochroleuca TaxID=152965 RepID=A0A9P5MRU9_9AGAM|nr:hypothetical protein DFH94DRAFT_109195 [Russula ochroleuca]
MRLFRVLPALSLLFGARASSSLDSRAPAPHRNDARDLLDVCASVDTNLVVPDILNILTAVGVIDVCLCLSALPLFLETNIVAILGIDIAGEPEVTKILTNLINKGAPQNCNYPTHSTPACINGNPCGFTCTDSFTASPPTNPTDCVCNPPSVVCNGVCKAGACPSSQPPSKKKRSWVGSGSCSDMGPGWAACGVFGGSPRAWECVDTAHDLESCGGCMFPLTAYSPEGKDCSILPGVADVSCMAGECVVHRCLPGYKPAPSGCVRKHYHHAISQTEYADEEDVPARVYGLEHVPLGRD